VLAMRLARIGNWRQGRWTRLGVLAILGGCALALLFSRDLGYPQAIPLQMLIGLFGLVYLVSGMREVWNGSR
jgi:hypothetical protein